MNETNRSLSKKEYNIVSELSSRKINIITIEKASKIFKIEKKELWAILHRLEKKGWLERIEKGKYHIITKSPGRAVRYLPAPPQIRTSSFSASGSSVVRLASRINKNV